MFLKIKDTTILKFLVAYYALQTDIIKYYLFITRPYIIENS